MTIPAQIATAVLAWQAYRLWRVLFPVTTYTEVIEMRMDASGKFWFDVWHEPVHQWCVRFKPVGFDVATETRGGFGHPHDAARCLELLAMEHCVDEECEA